MGSFPWFLPAILVEEKWCFLSEFEVPEPQGEVETLPEPVELQKPSTMATAGIATSRPLTLLLFLIINLLSNTITGGGGGGGRVYADNGVFSVRYKYAGRERCLSTLKAHDISRQLRFLAGVDIPLGGSGRPDAVGLYYAKIGIGTPPKDYYVQVDTGSDIVWVNCIQCRECPRKSSLGMELTPYDLEESTTGKLVSCDEQFCLEVNGGPLSGCTTNMSCPYLQIYGDGSSTAGYFVKDYVQYDRVSGDLETTAANGSIKFGCGARQSGDLGSSGEEALDGILGFGKSNSSIISQLASSRKVKKMFAHCLDGINGGGIFAIGHVVQPKVNMTPLVPNQPHYNVNMTGVQVGRVMLNISADVFEAGDRKGTIIDSGTTLAYLPELIYEPLVTMILSRQHNLEVQTIHGEYKCFQYSERVDDGFPPVIFHFENSLLLKVYPHEYLFQYESLWCIGWQNSGMQSRDRKNVTLFGDLVLSNKLVLYDLENQTIGWTEYNCSSSIKVQDEQTGTVHLVGSHYISSAHRLNTKWGVILLFLILLMHWSAHFRCFS